MAYPKGALWVRSSPSSMTAKATFVSVAALMVLAAATALYSALPTHQAINRADKADALVSLTELKAKQGLEVAWDRFFHEPRLADAQATNQFVAVTGDAPDRRALVVVADVRRKDLIAW